MNATDVGGATPSPQDQQRVTLPAVTDVSRLDELSEQQIKAEPDQEEQRPQHDTTDVFTNHETPSLSLDLNTLSKKRKRAASPPWQFPTAEQTTIKLSDGRRSSARVNISVSGTPALSESESQGRRQSRAASSRLTSPPWKEFRADGPTSMQVDGVRKSGRVNKELSTAPKRVSPRSKKQVDKLVSGKVSAQPVPHTAARRGRRKASDEWEKVDELSAQIAELKTQRQSLSKSKLHAKPTRWQDHDGQDEVQVARRTSPDSKRKSQRIMDSAPSKHNHRIKLRFNADSRHTILPPHPLAAFPDSLQPPHPSIWQLMEEIELKEMQQPYIENERGPPTREEFEKRHARAAEVEGEMRRKILEAAQPGGILSQERCSIYEQSQAQPEPAKQYGHSDHLVSHILWFRHLQLKEETWHKQIAKKLAHEAVERWRKLKGPTEDDLRAEADKNFRLTYKQVAIDVKAKWELVMQHVDDKRRLRWEADQEIQRQEKLRKQLEWSENMVAKQRGELDSDQSELDDEDGSDETNDEDDDSDENMTEESSEDDLPTNENDLDDDNLQAYLAQRESEPPDKRSSLAALLDDATQVGSEDENDTEMPDATNIDNSEMTAQAPTPVVAAMLSPHSDDHDLSSDESVDMDSEDYDSDEDMSDSEAEGSEDGHSASSEDLAPRSGLLGFFSKADLRAQGLPTPVTSAEGDHEQDKLDDVAVKIEVDNKDEPLLEDSQSSADNNDEEMADKTQVPAEVEYIEEPTTLHKTHLSAVQAASRADTPESQARSESLAKQLVASPALLRGNLRSYQHAGLDWLASLYRNQTNGILADEMGLGKTIQTISLFAHIAEQHNVWDAHLVIVPTSVILNWVTEFQKFLPGFRVLGYYGSTDERQAKRKHWVNDPHHEDKTKRGYNVIVTSYNIALRDIGSLRQVQWHYMVLDEAHNIRNFNSLRFQHLIKLKTRARLLLTGTPLQNSLTELWSLLTFLTAGRDDGEAAHGGLEEFLARWKEPVNEIFERGVQSLSDEASKVVGQLHTSLRPFMLRRLKTDVEKDLPKKTEHVVVCKLSKRQRQLYQDYMGLSSTKAQLTKGNAISAGSVLLSLRKVCNHPDLFDPRPIQTSYALEKSPLQPYSAKEKVVRKMLGVRDGLPTYLQISALESDRKYRKARAKQLSGIKGLQFQIDQIEKHIPASPPETSTIAGCQALQRYRRMQTQLQQLRDSIQYSEAYFASKPVYGNDLRELITVRSTKKTSGCQVLGQMSIATADPNFSSTILAPLEMPFDRIAAETSTVQNSLQSIRDRADSLRETIMQYGFCTPEVVAPVLDLVIDRRTQAVLRAQDAYPEASDPFSEARMRTSIVFPDGRLLAYDAGKLQRLTILLRELQAKKSRSLIFTQMAGTLNVLERFLSLINLPYLRLDGSTPIERRALYAAEFNRPDSKYQCMILSSRAGGVGLNLTGASSVIFYDLDWNPQMDKQCMDRAHRIGQVRDVDVFKLVSEKTVEENILRRANQKSLLDQTVIQEGHFTTEYGRSQDDETAGNDDVSAAIDRLLAGGDKAITKTIEAIEDTEDVQAAQSARKEELQDEEDFAERSSKGPSVAPTAALVNHAGEEVDMEGHIDSFMINYIEEALRYVPYVPPVVVTRDPGHRKKTRKR